MPSTITRRLSILLLVAAATGAALAVWTALAAVAALDRDGREMAERIDRLRAALTDIQTAQAGFLESGGVTSALLQQSAARLREIQADALRLAGDLRTTGASPEAVALVEAADALGAAVARGHDNLTAGRELMAADLLLSGTESSRRTVERAARALQAAESSAARAARTAALVRAWVVFSVAALAAAILLLARSRATGPLAARTESSPSEGIVPEAPSAKDTAPDVLPHPAADEASTAGGTVAFDLRLPSPVDLEETAALCTAIGRLATAADLPGLLERTRAALHASGVVVWMAVGDVLIPVASYGYDGTRVSALVPVHLADGNATAAAWRTARVQIVPAGDGTRGAIAAPMQRPDGCVGVLAVELDGGWEQDAATSAVTTILAAQFATVLSAEPASADALSA